MLVQRFCPQVFHLVRVDAENMIYLDSDALPI